MFQIGQTYKTRSMCDWDCVFSFTVVARTKQFITVDDGYETKRVKVWIGSEGDEWAAPYGKYSMSPCIQSSKQMA